MSETTFSLGIIGGTGMLGSAIASAVLKRPVTDPGHFWVSNRSGTGKGVDVGSGVRFTRHNQELVDNCDVILLCVPPVQFAELLIRAENRLVVSVMAGISVERLQAATGAHRVVRAMSSPAAALGLAYSPWFASPDVSPDDRILVRRLFEACGLTDEISEEDQIECFTAMTGPVPGFVALFADCMVKYACNSGIETPIAQRAVCQLFLAAGRMMASSKSSPSDHVEEMVKYNGTTAAGLIEMKNSSIEENIARGLDAAAARTRIIG